MILELIAITNVDAMMSAFRGDFEFLSVARRAVDNLKALR